jgi:uncharacterized RDD family membrane protein YckC
MDAYAARIERTAALPRAGFWRRWAAVLIDWIVVALPFQILAAILFTATAGIVQMDNGFFSFCAPTKTVPEQLDPAPPHDSNFAQVCRISFFGAPTGAILRVGRITREGTTTTTVSQSYMLDADGKPVHGTSIDWIVALAFLIYLVGMAWKTGRTVGARILGVRIIDSADPAASGVPVRKLVIRYLVMTIGFLPMFAVLVYQLVAVGGSADAMFTGDFFRWFWYAAVLGGLWGVVLTFQVATKRDPVYDRLAGTAVVRTRGVEPPNPPQ